MVQMQLKLPFGGSKDIYKKYLPFEGRWVEHSETRRGSTFLK